MALLLTTTPTEYFAMSSTNSSQQVEVRNSKGLHLRCAGLFVEKAAKFSSKVEICNGSHCVDGRSIMEVLTLGATQGTQLEIRAQGDDAESATAALVELINSLVQEDLEDDESNESTSSYQNTNTQQTTDASLPEQPKG